LYAAEVFDNRYIIASFQLTGHSYADNTQVYVTAPVRETQQAAARPPGGMYRVPPLVDGGNRLKLNAEKTQLLWLGNRQQLAKLTISRLPLVITAASSTVDIVSMASNLGIKSFNFDGPLTMTSHIYQTAERASSSYASCGLSVGL